MMNPEFWESHYQRFGVTDPSAFARYCVDRWIQKEDVVVEIGCGNGRDGQLIAENCAEYHAIDSSAKAIEQFSLRVANNRKSENINLHCSEVINFDFDKIVARTNGKVVFYSRFSLHSLDEGSEKYIFDAFLKKGINCLFVLEARTIFDPLHGVGTQVGRNAFVTDHYRRFIDPRDYLEIAMDKAEIRYFVLSDGFAMTETENPVVMRAAIANRGVFSA